jgi:hypothetical protein
MEIIEEKSCEISGSHGGKYEVQSLLGCTAVFSNRCRPVDTLFAMDMSYSSHSD